MRYFGLDDALGKVVQSDGQRMIVGIVGDVRHGGPEKDLRLPMPAKMDLEMQLSRFDRQAERQIEDRQF